MADQSSTARGAERPTLVRFTDDKGIHLTWCPTCNRWHSQPDVSGGVTQGTLLCTGQDVELKLMGRAGVAA